MATTGLLAKIYQCPYIRARTIAAVDSNPDTYTDTGNGFVLAGFVAGDSITVSGFTTGGNNGIKTIATIVAGTITLVGGDTLTAESAGDDVIIVKNVPGTLIGACRGWTTNQIGAVEDVTTFKDTVRVTYTTDTIAFVDGAGSDDTITDSDEGLIDAGFRAGDIVWITGSTSNNYTVRVSDVAAGVLTVPTGTVTAEIAGDTVTIRAISNWKVKLATAKDWTGTLDRFWATGGQALFGVPRRYEFFIKYYATPSGGDIAYYQEGLGIANNITTQMNVLEVVKEPITIEGIGALTPKSKTTAW